MRVYLLASVLLVLLLLVESNVSAAGPQRTPKGQTTGTASPCLDAARRAVEQGDDVSALGPYLQAAIRGDTKAQRFIGNRYAYGEEVPQNDEEALCWYFTAAERGDAISQSTIGGKYEVGEVLPQSLTSAFEWYHKAAVQGLDLAQHSLGRMYYQGRGVPQNYVEAIKWYTKAAEQTEQRSQTELGIMYMSGEGTASNFVVGYMLLILAAVDGEKRAMRIRDNSALLLTAAQLAKAQELARQWALKPHKNRYGSLTRQR